MVSNSSFWLILSSGLGTLRLFLIFTQQSEMKRPCKCFLRVKVECKFSLIIGLAILLKKILKIIILNFMHNIFKKQIDKKVDIKFSAHEACLE